MFFFRYNYIDRGLLENNFFACVFDMELKGLTVARARPTTTGNRCERAFAQDYIDDLWEIFLVPTRLMWTSFRRKTSTAAHKPRGACVYNELMNVMSTSSADAVEFIYRFILLWRGALLRY